MNKREIVQTLLDSVQKGDFEKAKSLLADDFQFSGPIPEPDQQGSLARNECQPEDRLPRPGLSFQGHRRG